MVQLPKRLKANKYLLYTLRKADPKLRNAIIKNSNTNFIKTLSEMSLNLLNGNVEHSPQMKNRMKKYKKKLRCLACSKRSIKAKRNILVQKGGFLPALIGSILSGIIGQLLQNG